MSQILQKEIVDLISTYHELNPDGIIELHEEPSPLEFMRYVARNRPFVVRGGAKMWPASQKWSLQYLNEVMAGQTVNVAITPLGNADSVLEMDNGATMFVKPCEVEMSFSQASHYIVEQEREDGNGAVCYCQTQNDNLRNEYESLFADVPTSIPFARIALERSPDAINFWLGNSRSTTALHKDPYENIFVQLLGQKHFVLLPPVEAACVNEQPHPAATYHTLKNFNKDADLTNIYLQPVLDEPHTTVPFATWDPDAPSQNSSLFSHLSKPLRVTLGPGDMMYLPALWYHKVKQSCSEEGLCCSINYWYDMDYSGVFYPLTIFTRRAGELAQTRSPAKDTNTFTNALRTTVDHTEGMT